MTTAANEPGFVHRVHELIDDAAKRHEDRVAVVCGERSLTYRLLRTASDALASQLIAEGIRPDDLVALYVDRSLELAVGVLGILKAGAAYVPLDPGYPAARRKRMIEVAKVRTAVCSPSHLAELAPLGLKACVLDGNDAKSMPEFPPASAPNVAQGRLAYTMFTSGTTGTPKGILTTHANLTHFLLAMVALFKPGPATTYLFRTSVSFDPHTLELFLPLMVGGCVVVAPDDESFSPQLLAERIARHRIDLMQATPSIWRAMLVSLRHACVNR